MANLTNVPQCTLKVGPGRKRGKHPETLFEVIHGNQQKKKKNTGQQVSWPVLTALVGTGYYARSRRSLGTGLSKGLKLFYWLFRSNQGIEEKQDSPISPTHTHIII